MAVVLGVNAGFVTEAPTSNPSGSTFSDFDTQAHALKHTTPAGAIRVTEIGWYAPNATEEANYEVGIYTDNAGDEEPEAVVGSLSTTNAKGTDAGWKVVTGLDIEISANTDYWIAVQLDDTATGTGIDYAFSGGMGRARKITQTALPDPDWGTSTLLEDDFTVAAYAIVEAADPDVTIEPSTLTMSTTETEPSYFIDITQGALSVSATLLAPTIVIVEPPPVVTRKLSGSITGRPRKEEEERPKPEPIPIPNALQINAISIRKKMDTTLGRLE